MRGVIGWFVQAGVVTMLNLRTMGQRVAPSVVAVVGVTGVVAVFVAVLSMAEGFRATMANTGSADTVLVMRSGSDSEMTSILLREDVRVIGDAAGIRRTAEGPVVSAELFVIVDLPKRSTGTTANVPLRGVQSPAFLVRDKLRLVEGRRFEPGRNELIAGRGAASQFAGLEVGRVLEWSGNAWTVVGIFDAGGTVAD